MKKKIKLVLIGGQSNAVGCTMTESLDEKHKGKEFEKVCLYQEGNFTAEAKYKIIPKVTLGMGCKPHQMGIEYGISHVLNELDGAFGLVRFAYGGTDLGFHWQTEFEKTPQSVEDKGYCYHEFVGTVKRGLAEFTKAGYDCEILGMVWMQGESDTNKTLSQAEDYERNLKKLFTAIRRELDLPELKIIVGGISTNPPLAPFSDIVRQKQKDYCRKDQYAIYIDNTDIPIGRDGWHYEGNEDLELGKRLGKYIKDYLLRGAQ